MSKTNSLLHNIPRHRVACDSDMVYGKRDPTDAEAPMEAKAPEDKPSTRDVWMRGLFMLFFIIAFGFGVWVLNFVAIVQFFWLLFSREHNLLLARFGSSLSVWLAEVGHFLACATDDKPFPWRLWPSEQPHP